MMIPIEWIEKMIRTYRYLVIPAVYADSLTAYDHLKVQGAKPAKNRWGLFNNIFWTVTPAADTDHKIVSFTGQTYHGLVRTYAILPDHEWNSEQKLFYRGLNATELMREIRYAKSEQ